MWVWWWYDGTGTEIYDALGMIWSAGRSDHAVLQKNQYGTILWWLVCIRTRKKQKWIKIGFSMHPATSVGLTLNLNSTEAFIFYSLRARTWQMYRSSFCCGWRGLMRSAIIQRGHTYSKYKWNASRSSFHPIKISRFFSRKNLLPNLEHNYSHRCLYAHRPHQTRMLNLLRARVFRFSSNGIQIIFIHSAKRTVNTWKDTRMNREWSNGNNKINQTLAES